ncbi:hypothetical protein CLV63_1478 [Murinocardiopsis flavida]|uniref:Uncharacterized protein n=1 Tax=Murinocardiopsis flavida TaxID=645275 RepID=A0A2P8C8V3_9ACTN|nr:hypothetical protein [Murinocardiopsis flavida]PSK81392.1 hypothetical protein CLV63_1478 [Murinocardiopsis flavida]
MPPESPEPTRPFRWDLVRRDQLGSLLGGTPEFFPEYLDEMVHCAARILALSADGDLYFVGRSADDLHDLLSGVLSGTSWRDRVRQLPLSLYQGDGARLTPAETRQLRVNLDADGLAPAALMRRDRPVVFTDLVASGSTFGNLHRLLRDWIAEERAPWDVIRTKLRYIGVTGRRRTSPNTWRWQQHAEWTAELPARAVRNVSMDERRWQYLAAAEPKITPSFRRTRWLDPSVAQPRHDDETRKALASAVALVEHGRGPEVRARILDRLRAEPAAKERWLRTFLPELRPR